MKVLGLVVAGALLVPGVALALLSGGGDDNNASQARANAAEPSLTIPSSRARAVEPEVGAPGVAAAPGVPESAPPPPATGGRSGRRLEISPSAPSDAQVRAEIEASAKEQAKVERAILASGAPLRPGTGRLILPVPGPLTSPFGPRWGRLHAGIDIAAPGGTPIRAADTGQVALAGPQGGYGNYTCVRHTTQLTTCYAHQSQILVRVGQVVTQGQVIGQVGSTGNSTGNHLHFETRINGQPVDPLRFL